jgi:hypothetical protein
MNSWGIPKCKDCRNGNATLAFKINSKPAKYPKMVIRSNKDSKNILRSMKKSKPTSVSHNKIRLK